MKPIKFKEQNCVYAENQEPYLPLPAHKHDDEWQCVSSCWGLSLVERIKVLITGRIYTTLPTFGKPLTPQRVEVDNPCRGKK
jgi:hypothetical protein